MYSKLWNCNNLWKIWYCLLVTLLQFFVTYNSIRKYIIFKSQYYNPRYGGLWNFGPLHLYIACIILSTSLIGFFLYFSIINTRKNSNSNIAPFVNGESENLNDFYGPITRLVARLMYEQLPMAPMIHMVMAVLAMIPLPVVQMEQIRNEALSLDSIWMVNFDFFSDNFRWLTMEPIPNAKTLKSMHYVTESSSLSVEFINFIIAALIFLIRLPGVLWYSNKWFSVLYSIIIFTSCLSWLIIYEAGSIFIKLSGNTLLIGFKKQIVDQIQYSTMLSFISIHFLLMLVGFIAIFDYGQIQSAICWLRGFKTFGCFNQTTWKKNCWIFSVITIGFILLLFTLIFDSFMFAAFFNCFQEFNATIFLVAIIFGVINLVMQFLVWFTFSIKNRWTFHLDLPGFVPNANRINDKTNKYANSPDTIYGCFHNNITLSTSSSHSSGRGTTRTMEGSSGDSVCFGNNFQNYVFSANTAAQIPTISEDYDENVTNTSKSSSINMKDTRNSGANDQDLLFRTPTSVSDNGLNKMNENLISETYRSLQMINGRKSGKLVTFHDTGEEKIPFFNTYEKRFSNSNMEQLNYLKVPDILNLNRPTLSGSQSESSLDQISSSISSKAAIEATETGMCSEV